MSALPRVSLVGLLASLAWACGGAKSGADAAGTEPPTGGAGGDAEGPGSSPEDTSNAPSSTALIQAAQEAGTLDEKTAAFYRMLAHFSPSRLPAEYQAAQPLRDLFDVSVLKVAKAHLDEYPASQATAVQAMLASPKDSNWMVFPPDLPSAHGLIQEKTSCFESVTEYGGHKPGVGTPVASTKHFVIYGVESHTPNAAAVNDLSTRIKKGLDQDVADVGGGAPIKLSTYLDNVYEYYRSLGMADPSWVPTIAAEGGKVPIWVAACDGDLNTAYENEGYIFVSVALAFENPTFRPVAIPHEMFHVFQEAYALGTYDSDNGWPYEATAVAVEDLVVPGLRRWAGFFPVVTGLPAGYSLPMDRSFKCPEEPIHTNKVGPCRGRTDSADRYNGGYSKFVLIKYLMKNQGLALADFWNRLAAAKGNPKGLISDDALAAFQVALVGDIQGQDPFFDPADRAAFFDAQRPQRSNDLDTNDPERYTYRLDPSVLGSSKSYRLAPSDQSSLAQTLSKLDASSSPIPAGGTHRLLLEVPDSVAKLQDPEAAKRYPLELVFTLSGCSKCSINVAALPGGDTGPGRVIDTSVDRAPLPWSTMANSKWTYIVRPGTAVPRYVMATISNLGTGSMTWKAGLTAQQACMKSCLDFYEDYRKQQQCPEYYCKEYKDTTGTQYQKCLNTEEKSTRTDSILWCAYACSAAAAGDSYPAQKDKSCPNIDWRHDICSNGNVADCSSIPDDFVPIPDWPRVLCAEMKASCPNKTCECSE